MDRKERLELEKQAQEKLSEAWRLIGEAGKLAKKGQFVLEFGEVGTFIPKRYADPELHREDAIELLKEEGWKRYDGRKKDWVTTSWKELQDDKELLETAVEHTIESIIEDLSVPWEYREYDGGEGTDDWWTPSRC